MALFPHPAAARGASGRCPRPSGAPARARWRAPGPCRGGRRWARRAPRWKRSNTADLLSRCESEAAVEHLQRSPPITSTSTSPPASWSTAPRFRRASRGRGPRRLGLQLSRWPGRSSGRPAPRCTPRFSEPAAPQRSTVRSAAAAKHHDLSRGPRALAGAAQHEQLVDDPRQPVDLASAASSSAERRTSTGCGPPRAGGAAPSAACGAGGRRRRRTRRWGRTSRASRAVMSLKDAPASAARAALHGARAPQIAPGDPRARPSRRCSGRATCGRSPARRQPSASTSGPTGASPRIASAIALCTAATLCVTRTATVGRPCVDGSGRRWRGGRLRACGCALDLWACAPQRGGDLRPLGVAPPAPGAAAVGQHAAAAVHDEHPAAYRVAAPVGTSALELDASRGREQVGGGRGDEVGLAGGLRATSALTRSRRLSASGTPSATIASSEHVGDAPAAAVRRLTSPGYSSAAANRKPTPRTVWMKRGAAGVVAELAPQPGDVHVERLGRAEPVLVPHLAISFSRVTTLPGAGTARASRSNSLRVSVELARRERDARASRGSTARSPHRRIESRRGRAAARCGAAPHGCGRSPRRPRRA